MKVGLRGSEFALIDQCLNIGVIQGALNQLFAMKMVNTGVTCMRPVAAAIRIDQKCGNGTVRFFLGGNSRELDNHMGFKHQLL